MNGLIIWQNTYFINTWYADYKSKHTDTALKKESGGIYRATTAKEEIVLVYQTLWKNFYATEGMRSHYDYALLDPSIPEDFYFRHLVSIREQLGVSDFIVMSDKGSQEINAREYYDLKAGIDGWATPIGFLYESEVL